MPPEPPPPPPGPYAFPPNGPWNENTPIRAGDPGNTNILNTLSVDDHSVPIVGRGNVANYKLSTYRHQAWFIRHEQKVRGVRENSVWYDHVLANMPTRKTVDFDKLCAALRYRLVYVDDLFNFCYYKKFLKWRFTTKVRSQRAIDLLVRKVVGNGNAPVIVALGDWSRPDKFIRGKPFAPNKRVIKGFLMIPSVFVHMTNEHKTSKKCCRCKGSRHGGKGTVLERANLLQKRKGVQGQILGPCWGVSNCKSCGMFFQRDVVGVHNIYWKARSVLDPLHVPEPSWLARGTDITD